VALVSETGTLARRIWWKSLTDSPVEFVELPREEIESGPALLFAGVDAVLLPTDAQTSISEARILALINAGVRIVMPARGDRPPTVGRLVWDHLDGQEGVALETVPGVSVWNRGTSAWVTPAKPLHRPAVIEPGLAAIHRDALAPPRRLVGIALGLGPIALAFVLIARGLFRRPLAVCAAAALSLIALAAGAVAYGGSIDTLDVQHAKWQEIAARDRAAVGGIAANETLEAVRTFLASSMSERASENAWVLPAAASARAYFSIQALRLSCDGGSTLQCRLPPRGAVVFQGRSTESTGLVPAMPDSATSLAAFIKSVDADPDRCWWIRGGHVSDAAQVPTASDKDPTVLQWAANQRSGISLPLRNWYELRFDGTHRYLMTTTPDGPRFFDFGAIP